MTFPSFLLILLLSLVSLHAMPKFGDSRLENMRASTMYIHKLLVEGDHVQRKVLHEVHSGPNPIGNSFPKQNCKTKLQRIP
ncbi:hypothetical protein CsSME_00018961 [Camellia sinensis var. sinensis]